jgi:hypothetical protein
MHKFNECELWGFYSVDAVDLSLLGYYADKQVLIPDILKDRKSITMFLTIMMQMTQTFSLVHKAFWRSRRNNTQAAAQNNYDNTQGSLSISSVLTMDRDLSETKHGL